MLVIRIKRIYEPPETSDGVRLLVDRLWPRGIAREAARIDTWIKDIAPSDALRRWYSHDLQKWPEFRARYLAELQQNPAVTELRRHMQQTKTLTLLYAAKDDEHNNAVVLCEFLKSNSRSR